MAGAGKGRTGMLAVLLVVGLEQMSKTASHAAMANSTVGRTEKMPEIQTMIERFGIEMVAPPRKRMASQDEPSLKEAGSVMRALKKRPMQMRINHSYATENGAVTDMAQTATGPAVLSSSKSLSGWIVTTESHDAHTRRKTSSAGRRE
jgi:hypothetical protein